MSPPSDAGARKRPAPLSPEAQRARQPPPPEELVGALQDRVHKETGQLIASTPVAGARAETPKLTRTERAALEWYAIRGTDRRIANWDKRPTRTMRHRLYAYGWLADGQLTDAGRRALEGKETRNG